jgi:hypothetical protein
MFHPTNVILIGALFMGPIVSGCSADEHNLSSESMLAAGAPDGSAGPPVQAQRRFPVMTMNLYQGADIGPLFVPGADLVMAAAEGYSEVQQTDFPARAEVIASYIAAKAPLLISLTEVSLWQTGPDLDHLAPSYDFLEILLEALAEQGASYEAVAVSTNASAALPMALNPIEWVSLTDRDVILARSDLSPAEFAVSNPTTQAYQALVEAELGGTVISAIRSWQTVEVKIRGKQFLFVGTRLEPTSPAVRDAQAQELLLELAAQPLPVVLAGDLQMAPQDTVYGSYGAVGLADAWLEAGGAADGGATAYQGFELDCTQPSKLTRRGDYVFLSGVDVIEGSEDLFGDEQSECTNMEPHLWPSDHAGLLLELHIANP